MFIAIFNLIYSIHVHVHANKQKSRILRSIHLLEFGGSNNDNINNVTEYGMEEKHNKNNNIK